MKSLTKLLMLFVGLLFTVASCQTNAFEPPNMDTDELSAKSFEGSGVISNGGDTENMLICTWEWYTHISSMQNADDMVLGSSSYFDYTVTPSWCCGFTLDPPEMPVGYPPAPNPFVYKYVDLEVRVTYTSIGQTDVAWQSTFKQWNDGKYSFDNESSRIGCGTTVTGHTLITGRYNSYLDGTTVIIGFYQDGVLKNQKTRTINAAGSGGGRIEDPL